MKFAKCPFNPSLQVSRTTVRAVMDNYKPDIWKLRGGPAGLHLFNRSTGLNILMDEIPVPSTLHSRAPRHVSIALTNQCDLACNHCYAPKSRDELNFTKVTGWITELNENGTLGIGFGGGEPTLYPELVGLCQHVTRETQLSVSFTTHGHHVDDALADRLRGNVNFIRVSMDGVGTTYEEIRQRSFVALLAHLKVIRSISDFGVNVVINERTLPGLSETAIVAADIGACELLLLPQVPVRGVPAITPGALQGLRRWVDSYTGPLKLFINEMSADGFPTCDPFSEERNLRAYAHIDATGILKHSSYEETGVQLGEGGVLHAITQLAPNLEEKDK
ncbi:MAG: radical SAM protein [Kiritimatiellia bacterium]|nr:radical SAM protein [Kiritimatiellia bacterium]